MSDLPIATRLRRLKWQVNCEMRGLVDDATAYEAADVIAALVDALLGAEGAIQAMGSQVDAEWRDHDKAATRHDSTVRAWRAKRDAALAKATKP